MSERDSRNKRKSSPSQIGAPGRKNARTESRTSDLPCNRSGSHYRPSAWGESVGPGNRIILQSELGKGTCSTVFRCVDATFPSKEFAVKFIRLSETLKQATETEIKLLRRFQTEAKSCDPEGTKRLLGLAGVEFFEHQNHLAFVFERQKCSLKTALLKYGQGKGLALVNLQSIGRDVFLALRVLRRTGIIHCDLKPANLLLDLDGKSVRLADFGSAVDMSARTITDQLQPTYYRAPEIILGQLYGMEIDIWSAGLTLFQLATGSYLMIGECNNAMLHAMLAVFGAFPTSFSTAGEFAMQHFNSGGSFRLGYGYVAMSTFPARSDVFLSRLESKIKDPPKGGNTERHDARIRQLADLLMQCVVPDPTERITPEAALDQSFVQQA